MLDTENDMLASEGGMRLFISDIVAVTYVGAVDARLGLGAGAVVTKEW